MPSNAANDKDFRSFNSRSGSKNHQLRRMMLTGRSHRKRWTKFIGISGRGSPEWVDEVDRNMQAFRKIRKKASVIRRDNSRYQPRLHDLRHTFAVHRLTAWYKEGSDVQKYLPILSEYLGHTRLSSTSVYLTMTPALLEEAGKLFQRYVFTEVPHE